MTTGSEEHTVVSARVYDPATSIFKANRNDHAECTTIRCNLAACPLRDKGTCTWIAVIGHDACPYGKYGKETGPTKRARGYGAWLKARREKYAGIPSLGSPAKKLAFIGDHVYLPYAHMDMHEDVPFLRHGGVFQNGCAFIPREAWTLKTVVALLRFHPQALMGGEILTYQKEEVPKFLQHLREEDPAMFEELVKAHPLFDVPVVHKGRKAFVRTLKPGIEWDAGVNEKYPVHWKWDGKTLTTTSRHVHSSTFGGSIDAESVTTIVTPSEKAVVIVQDESWVTPETIFSE